MCYYLSVNLFSPRPLLRQEKNISRRMVLFAFLFLISTLSLFPGEKIHKNVTLNKYTRALLPSSDQIYLSVLPHRGDGYYHVARRYTGKKSNARIIRKLNGNRSKLYRRRRIRIPFAILTQAWKKKTLTALFPMDHRVQQGWEHRVVKKESLWRIAEWFTGEGKNYKYLREINTLATLNTFTGQKILIPSSILLPALRRIQSVRHMGNLEYHKAYAVYRLKKGEALYTSVVVRFTGNVEADDVNAMALEYAKKSGIRDVTKIPVGYPIRIPLDDLLPQFLPEGNPRRTAWEKDLQESIGLEKAVEAKKLEGIYIILDAGHGGVDTGAQKGGVWESTYVYDIMCRISALLKEDTEAHVYTTILDQKRKDKIIDADRLPQHHHQVLLTTPRYSLSNVKMGVNLRWYLVNSIAKSLEKKGVDKTHIVFMTLHADALHASLRGATVYIPGARYYKGRWNRSNGRYARYREVKNASRVVLSKQEKLQSEGMSRGLSRHIIEAFNEEKLQVHKYGPIRTNIIRRRRRWVPAVLRYNIVPTRLLLEVCNLNNREDRALLLTRKYREKVAQAVVDAIIAFYGERSAKPPQLVAHTGM